MTAVQNSVDRRHMGAATASVAFFRSMGGAIGTALFGAILNIRLAHHLSEIVRRSAGPAGPGGRRTNDVTAIQALPEPVKSWVLTPSPAPWTTCSWSRCRSWRSPSSSP